MKKIFPFLLFIFVSLFTVSLEAQQWYKGELHTHTIWSDGQALPEVAVQAYKDDGFNFVCLTEHNIMQLPELRFSSWGYGASCPDAKAFEGEDSFWKQVTNAAWCHLAPEVVEQAVKQFGSDTIITKKIGDATWCRLKTFEELNTQFTEPGKFLLLHGFEQTEIIIGGVDVHLNFLNVPKPLPSLPQKTVLDTIKVNLAEGIKAYGCPPGEIWLFTVNHPIWRYYNIQPSDLIAVPEIRFVELLNNDANYDLIEQGWTPEKFWDVVNAFRCENGQQLLLVNGTSDRHSYKPENTSVDVYGWTYVWANELTAESIFTAMTRGDCYSSNGIELEKIAFDKETATLTIAVKPEVNRRYRIDFIGTKKDFDHSMKTIHLPAGVRGESPERDVEIWSDEIGVVLASTEGTEASYTLPKDVLYVRARVVTLNQEGNVLMDRDPKKPTGAHRNIFPRPGAWTQPFRCE